MGGKFEVPVGKYC